MFDSSRSSHFGAELKTDTYSIRLRSSRYTKSTPLLSGYEETCPLRRAIEGWCNGSTEGFDPSCLGSSPSPPATLLEIRVMVARRTLNA